MLCAMKTLPILVDLISTVVITTAVGTNMHSLWAGGLCCVFVLSKNVSYHYFVLSSFSITLRIVLFTPGAISVDSCCIIGAYSTFV